MPGAFSFQLEDDGMQAAVVSDFSKLPQYGTFPNPEAEPGEVLVRATHAALSNLVKGQASGRHYSSRVALPFVPGIDGTGHLEDGTRVYFAFPRAPYGSMAEAVPVRPDLCVALPPDLDSATAAASANAGMSSWAALVERAKFVAGETVLINGATGVSGRLAVSVAKYLGAKHIIATGRNAEVLERLKRNGADAVIPLIATGDSLTETFRQTLDEHNVSVVLDYLWGEPAACLLQALSGGGSPEGAPRVRFVQIGSSAGPAITLEGSTLRSSGIELLGSGLGSVALPKLVAAIGAFFAAFVPGKFEIASEAVPLAEVASAWNRKNGSRLVFTV